MLFLSFLCKIDAGRDPFQQQRHTYGRGNFFDAAKATLQKAGERDIQTAHRTQAKLIGQCRDSTSRRRQRRSAYHIMPCGKNHRSSNLRVRLLSVARGSPCHRTIWWMPAGASYFLGAFFFGFSSERGGPHGTLSAVIMRKSRADGDISRSSDFDATWLALLSLEIWQMTWGPIGKGIGALFSLQLKFLLVGPTQ